MDKRGQARQLLGDYGNSLSNEDFVIQTQALLGSDQLYPIVGFEKFPPGSQRILAGKLLVEFLSQETSQKKKEKEEIPDYYELLGISQDATPEEIEEAYQALLTEHHPNNLEGDATEEDRAQSLIITNKLQEAHEILSKEESREAYDKKLEARIIPEEKVSYARGGSIIINYDAPEEKKSPKTKHHIPINFFDQSRIMRLREGPEKNLAIAMMLSRHKVSDESFDRAVGHLQNWGKLKKTERINEHLDQVANNLATLNDHEYLQGLQKSEGLKSTNAIGSLIVIQPNGIAITMTDLDQDKPTITEHRSINVVPQHLLKQTNSVTIDISQPIRGETDLALSNINFPFRNNPIFQELQGKAGGLLKKQALKTAEKAGIKVSKEALQAGAKGAGKAASKAAAAAGMKVATKLGLKGTVHAITQALGTSLPVVGNIVAFIGTEILGRAAGLIKKYSKEIATLGLGLMFFGAAGGSAVLTGVGGLATLPHVASVGPGTAASGIIGTAAGVLSALVASAVIAISSAVVVIGIAGTIFVTLVLFIINNSAFVTPQGETIRGGYEGSLGNLDSGGFPATKCINGTGPSGWPVEISQSHHSYNISQGAFTSSGWSHYQREAIDVVRMGTVTDQDFVINTHDGTISNAGIDPWRGLFVDIRGSCTGEDGKEVLFRSRHVHFSVLLVDSFVDIGRQAAKGERLGIIGCTGICKTPHDHYEFRAHDDGGSGYANPLPPIKMEMPHIPETPPRGCIGNCNINIP